MTAVSSRTQDNLFIFTLAMQTTVVLPGSVKLTHSISVSERLKFHSHNNNVNGVITPYYAGRYIPETLNG